MYEYKFLNVGNLNGLYKWTILIINPFAIFESIMCIITSIELIKNNQYVALMVNHRKIQYMFRLWICKSWFH